MKYLLILILLCSCSQSQRCQRHMDKAKELGCLTEHTDTVITYDTIKGFSFDTIVQFRDTNLVDTMYVASNGVKVKTIVKWKTREVTQRISESDIIIRNLNWTKWQPMEYTVNKTPTIIKISLGALMLICLLLAFKK